MQLFISFYPGTRPKNKPFCVRHFAAFSRTELNRGQNTYSKTKKRQTFLGHAFGGREFSFYLLWRECGRKQPVLVCVICRVLPYRAKLRPNIHYELQKRQSFSRTSSAREFPFIFFRRARPKPGHFCVRQFATFCHTELNCGQTYSQPQKLSLIHI